MPTYEYRCPQGHEFERFQRMSDEPRADCPTCGEVASRLLSAGAGFLFRGDGFYITDYRSESYRKAASREGSGEAPAGREPGAPAKGDAEGASGRPKVGGGSSGSAPASGAGQGGSTSSGSGSAAPASS